MNWQETILIMLITALVAIPFCVFFHELGHATAALFLTKGPVRIVFGSFLKIVDIKIMRLEVKLFLLPSFVGYCRWFGKISDLSSAIILMSGPLASASICAICSCVLFVNQISELLYFSGLTLMVVSCTVFILTSIPVNYPKWLPGIGGWPSDGQQAVRYIRKANKFRNSNTIKT